MFSKAIGIGSYPLPKILEVDESMSAQYKSFDALSRELEENGVLIALGRLRPKFFVELCVPLGVQINGQEILTWPDTMIWQERPIDEYAMLFAAQKVAGRAYVYFVQARSLSPYCNNSIGQYELHSSQTLYALSYERFYDYVSDVYRPVSYIETNYIEKLCSLSLDSSLNVDDNEKAFKAVGQAIFDEYKTKNGGRSLAGQEAIWKIYNEVKQTAVDGEKRCEFINNAWQDIGDATWRFNSLTSGDMFDG
jgi:hypothetical protein